jgi:catecholate siderophore receptor
MMPTIISKRLLQQFFIFSILCVLLASAQAISAQTALRGKVLDQNRAAVSDAVVTVETKSGTLVSSATTDHTGEFVLAIVPGEYLFKVLAKGFTETKQVLEIGQANSAALEIVLQVAGSDATVTISDVATYQTEALGSATKTLTLVRDVPQSIAVVGKEQIKDQSFQSIADVVNYIPGITAHQGENNRDQLVIRGNNTSADFFLNGVRDDVQYYRDLYNVERVEALKGPNAMIFGRGGGGGVINRVTKEAGFSPLRELTLQGGTFGNKRVAFDFNQPINDRVALRLNSLYENSDSFRQFVNRERYGLNPTLTMAVSAKTRITLGYEHFHDGRTADRGIPSFQGRPADTAIETFYGNPDNSRVHASVNLLSASVEHQMGNINIRNRTMYGDYDRFYQNYVPGAVTANKAQVALTAYNNATGRRNFFNQTDLTYVFSTGRIKHTFLAGTEFGRQLTDNFRNTGFFNNRSTSILVSYDNPTITTPVTFRQSATDADNHLKTNLAATYVQDQVSFSRRLQLIAGLRFDYFDLQYHNNRTNEDLRRIDRLVSPRVGLVFKPITPVSVYANYSVAYLPSSGDQFSSLTTITQQVEPEKFSNYEVGMKWDVRSYLSLTTALYRQHRTNTRATDPLDPTRILQTGSQRTDGFEVALNGNVTRSWQIAGGYAYQDAFITSATTAARQGAQVAQVPHHTFSLWNNYRVVPRLGLGLGLIHRADMFAAIDNTVVLPSYTRVDAAVFVPINERWRLQANVENVLDRKYYLNADNNNNISPGSPRALRFSLTARF